MKINYKQNCTMIRKSLLLLIGFILLSSTSANSQNPVWSEVSPGVWKAVVGVPDHFDLLKAADVLPNSEALAKLGQSAFPLQTDKIVAETSDGKTYLRFPLLKAEQLYGFGLNSKPCNNVAKSCNCMLIIMVAQIMVGRMLRFLLYFQSGLWRFYQQREIHHRLCRHRSP